MHKIFLLMIAVMPVAATVCSSPARAETQTFPPELETLRLGGNFSVREGETKSVALDGPRYVKNLVIQAQGNYAESTVEVMVNGEVKGTLVAPGHDPSYVVTVGETTRSIEFRYRSGGSVWIGDVTGTVSRWLGEDHGGGFSGTKDQVIDLAVRALHDVEALYAFATPEEQNTYLFPIKRNAGLVYVMASAHGEMSRRTVEQLRALSEQIDFSRSDLDQLMQKDGAFDAVVELLTVRENINALLE